MGNEGSAIEYMKKHAGKQLENDFYSTYGHSLKCQNKRSSQENGGSNLSKDQHVLAFYSFYEVFT